MCTLSGTLFSSKELLTSAGGGIGGGGAAACFELLALVGCFDLFGEMVGGESTDAADCVHKKKLCWRRQ